MNKKTLSKILIGLPIALSIAFFQSSYAFAEGGPKNRDQVETKYKWSIDEIYPTKDAFNNDCKKITEVYIPKVKSFQGKLKDSKAIYDCLVARDEMNRTMEKLVSYAHMKFDENQKNSQSSELASIADSLTAKVAESSAFIQPEILEQDEAKIKSYMNDPILKDYKYNFDQYLKQKPHTLSKEGEEIVASASDIASSPNDIYTKLKTNMQFPKIYDPNGKEFQITNSSYSEILDNKYRYFRKQGFEKMYESYDGLKDTFASTLTAEVKKNIFLAKSKNYNSSLEAALSGEAIPTSVYDNLINSVNKNVGSLHKYVTLRKDTLNLDKVHLYDMYVPLVNNYDLKVPYEDGKKLVLQGLRGLGDDYINTVENAFDQRWIDVYETENKAPGAYSWGSYDTKPYILTNYNDSIDSVLTVAHEMGHSMNSYYTHKNQEYVNGGTSIFTGEVASTTNELLMLKHLINNAKSDEEKLFYINTLIEDIRGTIFTQTMYAEFEKAIHEKVENGEALSADTLCSMWKSLMEKYYGKDFEDDELANLWWARIPHMYMDFYVYKYATSMSAANKLSKDMTEGTDESKNTAKKKYLEFLSAGTSDYPIEILKRAGVDMNSSESVDSLLKDFDSLVNQMEDLLKKIKNN